MLRLKKCAKSKGQSLTDFVQDTLSGRVKHVSLSADDYRRIAEATEKARRTHRRCATEGE
jgi:hypothetical protein